MTTNETKTLDETTVAGIDRRLFASLGLGLMASIGGAGSVLAGEDRRFDESFGIPAHLKSFDPSDPNAFIPYTYSAASAFRNGFAERGEKIFEEFIETHLRELRTSGIPRHFAKLDAAGALPTTIRDAMVACIEGMQVTGANGTAPAAAEGSLCIEGPENCIDTGCDALNGDCWDVPEIIQETGVDPCVCVAEPRWYEWALLALLALILLATPGPDEVPAMLYALSRLIIRAAPAIA
ncbi:MAG: hypothetical protein AAGD38_13455 [Acidobacteriota bacterium]